MITNSVFAQSQQEIDRFKNDVKPATMKNNSRALESSSKTSESRRFLNLLDYRRRELKILRPNAIQI